MTQTDTSAHYDVIVIGAGPAGAAAAVRAAELGSSVAVLEANRPGGVCVNSGCVPTRVLAKTARLLRDVRHARTYGVAVNEPVVHWAETVARVRQVIEDVHGYKRLSATLEEAGAELYQEGLAQFIDPFTVKLADSGRQLRADTFIVCVGRHSARLPVSGAELMNVPEEVLDFSNLPASVVIVGSGYTGVQLATVFNAFGAEVTLLETQPQLLPSADQDVSRALTEAFSAQGIRVLTGIGSVEQVARHGELKRTSLTLGDKLETIDADAVIACVGWPVSAENLNLGAAGVDAEPKRIPTGAYYQTNVPHIFVAGDATGAGLVQTAARDGFAAATNAVLGPRLRSTHPLLPSGGFTDPDYGSVGLTEAEARERDPECLVASVPYAQLERALIDGRTTGFFKLICDRHRSSVLGAHAVGEGALELIQAVTTAVAAGTDLATLASVEFAYPTYTAILGSAAQKLLRV